MAETQAVPLVTPKNSRMTIGVFAPPSNNWYGNPFISALSGFAIERDVNLMIIMGQKPDKGQILQNSVYRLVTDIRLDGLILYKGIGNGLTPSQLEAICQAYAPLPVISFALQIPGVPTVLADSSAATRMIISHLIEEHHNRCIGFIRGPAGHVDSELRYQAYLQTLQDHNIAPDPKWIVDGDWSKESGGEAMRTLLHSGVPFQAVAAANDNMALGALELLQSIGKNVPGEIAITGFDDSNEARLVNPPLTTVRQSYYSAGWKTGELLLSVLNGAEVPDVTLVPADIVIRESCGCRPSLLQKASQGWLQLNTPDYIDTMHARRTAAVDEMISSLGKAADDESSWGYNVDPGFLKDTLVVVWDAFVAEVTGSKQDVFLPNFDQALQLLQVIRRDRSKWHEVLSIMRQHLMSCYIDPASLQHAEMLLQQARYMIGESALRRNTYERQAIDFYDNLFEEFDYRMLSILDTGEMADVLKEYFPQFSVDYAYLVLYTKEVITTEANPGAIGRRARLFLEYENGTCSLLPNEATFDSFQLLPDRLIPHDNRFSWVMVPLSVGDRQLGFMIIEVGPMNWEVYSKMRDLISGTLFRSLLVQEQKETRENIESLLLDVNQRAEELAVAKKRADTANTQLQVALRETEGLFHAAQSILGSRTPLEICQKLTAQFNSLVQADRMYIFIVNHEAREIVQSVYHGNIDDDMNTSYDELLSGISGMVFSSSQPILSISADDGIEPEETRERRIRSGTGALIVCPLITQERVIGTVTAVNRINQRQFTQHDVDLLMALTAQAAAAIENARLTEELALFNQQLEEKVQKRTEEVRQAYEQLEQLDRAKSKFIGITSHELRTPITVIRGYSQILETNPAIKNDANLQNIVKGILSGTNRMYELVNSMLDLAKIDNQTLKLAVGMVYLPVHIKEVAATFTEAFKTRNLTFETRPMSDVPMIEADPETLRKVFQNLIGNAIKYTPDGGRITITGRLVPAGEILDVEAVEVIVEDTGIGINPAHLELIFAKFFQTGEVALHSTSKTMFKGGGPGLGLTIARGIVSAHGGKLWAESPGYDENTCPGSRFHLVLPVHYQPQTA